MYKDDSQLRIEDFVFPYGKLDPENDWIKLAALVSWDVAEEWYAARFVNNVTQIIGMPLPSDVPFLSPKSPCHPSLISPLFHS